MYNSHSIQKQKAREFYFPAGKSDVMYYYPKDSNRNYSSYPDSDLLTLLESQLSWFDDTAYLSTVMRVLCNNIALCSGIPYDSTKILPGLNQSYTQVYKILQAELFQ